MNYLLRTIVAGLLLTGPLSGCRQIFGETYVVKSIKSHYPHKNNNSQTNLLVYVNGESGHVKEVLCAFPPEFTLEGSNETGWSGIRRVKIKGEAERFMFGKVSYYAEKLE